MTQQKRPDTEEADDYQQAVLKGMLELAEREAGRALTPRERRAIKEEYLAAHVIPGAVSRRRGKSRPRTSSAATEYRWQPPVPVRQWRRKGE